MSSSQTEKQPGSPATSHQSSQESSKPASSSVTRSRSISPEGPRPPLPPRNRNISLLSIRPPNLSHPSSPALSPNETLQGEATTALSKTEDVYAQNTGPSQLASQHGSDTGDSMSIRSSRPGHDTRGEITSIFGDTLGAVPEAAAQGQQSDDADGPGEWIAPDRQFDLREELEDIGELTAGGDNEEYLLEKWKAKQKHFLILSAAGKPIYSRHGDVGLISGYVGIIQTIISFYQDSKDTLKSFAAGGANFAIITRGPLYLVAISKLLESNAQLQSQLEALYMQILSTLTLPALTHLFSVRPSTDLRRPLQGTDSLLDSLADSFTRGSPSTLLSALECLRLRKSQRQVINNTLMKSKVDSLLYGLIVTGGRLVSVIRPKKHSLHPSDLQLVFNMLFEAGAVKNGGGENWIPICLPGFNSRGYLHMYVGFLGLEEGNEEELEAAIRNDEAVAILLISADKESFFELRKMKDTVVEQLRKNGSLSIIQAAVQKGRPLATDIVPGTVLRHFIYKSKGNVQLAMPSYEPHFNTLQERRNLVSVYNNLHASVHAKHAHVKIHHDVSQYCTSLAWVTPMFELYCIANKKTSRNALTQNANRVIQWIQKEEERVFIIGGAVF